MAQFQDGGNPIIITTSSAEERTSAKFVLATLMKDPELDDNLVPIKEVPKPESSPTAYANTTNLYSSSNDRSIAQQDEEIGPTPRFGSTSRLSSPMEEDLLPYTLVK
jgi:hypothetical protein